MWRSFTKLRPSDRTSLKPTTLYERLERHSDALALVVLCAVSLVALFTFKDYGLGWDDYTHSQYGELLLQYYLSGFTDRRALSFVNLYMYGGGFDMVAAMLDRITPFEIFETRRFLGAAVGIFGLAMTWRLARRVGGPLAGLLALLLLAACPLYYGHMFMNPKDAPFAVAMTILLYGLVRLFEDYPRPSTPTAVIFGLGLGLSIGSRIMGGLASLYVIVPFAIMMAATAQETGARAAAREFALFLLRLVPAFAIGYAIMAVIWPWSIAEPLNPLRAIGYFTHFFEKPWKEMYEGSLIAVPDMPRSYVPVNFALKMPEILSLLAIAGLAMTVITVWRGDSPPRRRAILALLAGAAAIPVLLPVLTRPAMYNGIRHFVFVAPALAVLGGLGGAWIARRAEKASRIAIIACAMVFLIGVADPTIEMIRLHPYQYTHFNRIAGGIEEAEERFMLDYWGLAFKEASHKLRETLNARKETPPHGHWRIAVCGPHPPAQVELGPEFQPTWDPKGADFALMLGQFYCARLDAPVMVEVSREDVVFARVYDIRGHNITTLFTIPPVR